MVKNINASDLALIELLRDDQTGAPARVLEQLAAAGFVALAGGTAVLTPAGRARAEQLRTAEGELRRRFAAPVQAHAIQTVAAHSLHG